MKPGILVVGFDAATLDLIDPWTQAGHLPVLGSLIKEGVSARLSSTPNMHSASAWTSILTGLGVPVYEWFLDRLRNKARGVLGSFCREMASAQDIKASLPSRGRPPVSAVSYGRGDAFLMIYGGHAC